MSAVWQMRLCNADICCLCFQINRQLAPFHRSCYGAIYFTGVIPSSDQPPNVIAEPSKASLKGRQRQQGWDRQRDGWERSSAWEGEDETDGGRGRGERIDWIIWVQQHRRRQLWIVVDVATAERLFRALKVCFESMKKCANSVLFHPLPDSVR